jgi:26S proteasome regulatory subunit N4
MGFRMDDDIHAPSVASGATTDRTSNDAKKQSLQELIKQKENLEAELSALGSVLDSVCEMMLSWNI